MLAAAYRLKQPREYQELEEKGRLFQSDSFGLAYLKRADKGVPRFGFIVSNKVAADAFQRNRVKRCLREAVRYAIVYLKPGYNVVFLAKAIIVKKSSDAIMKETEAALKAVGLFK
jgi:ribonuclease P protein component